MAIRRARIFRNGGSQAVRLPKAYRFAGEEVIMRREGKRVILEPVHQDFSDAFVALVRGEPDQTFPARQQPGSTDRRAKLK